MMKKFEKMWLSKLQYWKNSCKGRHTHKIYLRFYIYIFFPYNDTVVDAQNIKIFGHTRSILYVFLSQNLLICSSPARILLCKFLKKLCFAQKLIVFVPNSSNFTYFSVFFFFRLDRATWFGNLEEMTNHLTRLIKVSFSFLLFLNDFSVSTGLQCQL